MNVVGAYTRLPSCPSSPLPLLPLLSLLSAPPPSLPLPSTSSPLLIFVGTSWGVCLCVLSKDFSSRGISPRERTTRTPQTPQVRARARTALSSPRWSAPTRGVARYCHATHSAGQELRKAIQPGSPGPADMRGELRDRVDSVPHEEEQFR